MTERRHALRLAVLALDGVMLSSLAAAGDCLRIAERLAEIRLGAEAPRFSSQLVHARGAERVASSAGLELSGIRPLDHRPDVLLIPGIMHASPGDLLRHCAELDAEIELVRALHLQGVHIAASCSGTFLLAQTGLLDGRSATTSWWLAAAFRQAFPAVQLQADAMLVEQDRLTTTGGATAAVDFMLRQIGRAGSPELAQQTAKLLLVDPERQSQAPYVSTALMEKPRSTVSEKLERFLAHNLHQPLSVARIAEHCGTSERSLLRHFHAHYGESPLAHLQRLRIERAKALLETSLLSFEEIVERCGYSDAASFRKLFKRATHLTPADYRSRFHLRAS